MKRFVDWLYSLTNFEPSACPAARVSGIAVEYGEQLTTEGDPINATVTLQFAGPVDRAALGELIAATLPDPSFVASAEAASRKTASPEFQDQVRVATEHLATRGPLDPDTDEDTVSIVIEEDDDDPIAEPLTEEARLEYARLTSQAEKLPPQETVVEPQPIDPAFVETVDKLTQGLLEQVEEAGENQVRTDFDHSDPAGRDHPPTAAEKVASARRRGFDTFQQGGDK